MRNYLIVFSIIILAFIASSCGTHTEAQKQCKINVGIVFDIGGKNDRSFNAAAWEGVQRAEKNCRFVCMMSSREIRLRLNRRCALLPRKISI
jgi:basic membrane lipoprotein Med (substrate-binding protein (PBP1-ABC) superfamily)